MAAFGTSGVASLLQSAMSVAALNHRIIANNIANADTPHFTPATLDFQATLNAAVAGGSHAALRTSRFRHLDSGGPVMDLEKRTVLAKNDFNQVDLEGELVKLAENRSRFTLYSQVLSNDFQRQEQLLDFLNR